MNTVSEVDLLRDELFCRLKKAQSTLFTAQHYWASKTLNHDAPNEYLKAAKAYKDFAFFLEDYANNPAWVDYGKK